LNAFKDRRGLSGQVVEHLSINSALMVEAAKGR